MTRPDNLFREVVAQLAREELRGSEHPSVSRLVAYHRGELAPAEAAVVSEHLALCGTCTDLLLEAAGFLADDEEEEEADPEEIQASWERLQSALASGQAPPALPAEPARPVAREIAAPSAPARTPPPLARRPSLFHSLRFAYGLAAVLAALSLGLALFPRGGGAPAPRPNEPAYDLVSAGSERRADAAETALRLSHNGSAHLILNPIRTPTAPRHRVRIRGADGRVAWQSDDFVPQALGTFRLGLPAGALPPGKYTVELYGLRDGREEPLGTYPIALQE